MFDLQYENMSIEINGERTHFIHKPEVQWIRQKKEHVQAITEIL